MPRIIWQAAALEDVDRLLGFLTPTNPDAARRAAQAIARAVVVLADMPDIGRLMDAATGRRELAVPFAASAYVLRYRRDGAGSVVIIRVWHGREDRR